MSLLTRSAVNFRWVTLALTLIVIGLGVRAATLFQQELLPPVEFPQTIILAQVAGMNSDQVLKVVTKRLEAEIATIPQIVNLDSTTTGAFGAVIVAANNFGEDQTRIRDEVQAAIDRVWFPSRQISAPLGEAPQDFARRLLGDLDADTLLYWANRRANFLFQLDPAVWSALPKETVRAALAYLAQQDASASAEKSALQRLVEQQIVPQVNALDAIASVVVSGGQTLPGETVAQLASVEDDPLANSALFQLSPRAWAAASARVGLSNLDKATIEALRAETVRVPTTAPTLPTSWQMDFFSTADDLLEIASATRSTAQALNGFITSGVIRGAKAKTDDLTVDDVQRMLAIEPTLIETFDADQLAALPAEVLAILPEDFVEGLDGFARDALAARALAESLTGQSVVQSVNLPSAWRIAPPQIITFSFANIPLATFSVFSTAEGEVLEANQPEDMQAQEQAGGAAGGGLGQLFGALGGIFAQATANNPLRLGQEWNTLAERPELTRPLATAADLLAYGEGSAALILNRINAEVPKAFSGYEVRLFNSLTPQTVAFFAQQEADFFAKLDSAVLLKFAPQTLASLSEDVLARLDAETAAKVRAIAAGDEPSAAQLLAERYQRNVIPPDPSAPALNADWAFVANFLGIELNNAFDFFRFPQTQVPSAFINSLFDSAQGANFAPGLLGNMSLEAFQYLAQREPNFINNLVPRALNLFSDEVKATFPQDIKDKAAAGEVFRPTASITRTNGASSLLVTLFKNRDANTVEAFYRAREIMERIDAENDDIAISVAFEQSSFIEESISGVVREGTLGAIFAIIIILVFLSGGVWPMKGRRPVGLILILLSLAWLSFVVGSGLEAAQGDWGRAWYEADTIFRVMGLMGFAAGLLILFWRGTIAYPAWRSTLVIAVSIPLSILSALALMYWLPPFMNQLLQPYAEGSGLVQFLLRLFPSSLTLNIMTLSGLTVAIGRVVDDSIVVLENIFRQIQMGVEKREAILTGAREVSVAVFSATSVTMVVFLPLGLTGGLIGEFFLPFGLAVTYSLIASYLVAITVVPALAYLFISAKDVVEAEETFMERLYVPILKLALRNNFTRWTVVVLAIVSAGIGAFLFASRPAAFLPNFGEEQITIDVTLPELTGMVETNQVMRQLEDLVTETIPADQLVTMRTIIGGGGLNFQSLISGNQIRENRGEITISTRSSEFTPQYVAALQEGAEAIFASYQAKDAGTPANVPACREVPQNELYTVSATTLTSGGGFGGFQLVMSGADQATLQRYDACVSYTLNSVPGLANVSGNLAQSGAATHCPELVFRGQLPPDFDADAEEALLLSIRERFAPAKVILDSTTDDGLCLSAAMPDGDLLLSKQADIEAALAEAQVSDVQVTNIIEKEVASDKEEGSTTYIRVNQSAAISYTGETTTEDTINLAPRAIRALNAQLDLPEGVTINQGFNTQFQTQGFADIFVAMGIAIVIVVAVLVVLFGSPIYWLAVIFSIVVAPVGAAVALTLSNRVLGISALIGLLMLLGLVVTNAIVLIDRVGQNRYERGMPLYDALIEAGSRRLRPILMTSLATIIALTPLAAGLSNGAIIASELGTVVIGGVFSSTVLTLIVVPSAYALFTPLHEALTGRQRRMEQRANKQD
ncbi:MAG: efflux RND transporter permease subunit [Anaerolineae bacterium]|nr:efflux RND transporter permease subunit [Anaerolineae bacterium]